MVIGGGNVAGRGGGGEDVEELVNDPGPFFWNDLGIAPPPLLLLADRSEEAVLLPDPLIGCCG